MHKLKEYTLLFIGRLVHTFCWIVAALGEFKLVMVHVNDGTERVVVSRALIVP